MSAMFPSRLRPSMPARTWNQNPGNHTVRSGVLTLGLFLGLIGLEDHFRIPSNAFVVGLIVALLFAFATLFPGCLNVANYVRGRKRGLR
jgi:uncharacterized membrane-anchored protein